MGLCCLPSGFGAAEAPVALPVAGEVVTLEDGTEVQPLELDPHDMFVITRAAIG